MADLIHKIPASDIVAFAPFARHFPIRTDVVYANASHPENQFAQIYHPASLMQGHRDLVRVVLTASWLLNQEFGWTLVVKDCLRPVEAQSKMIDTPIVKANPHWLEEPRFLSGPGQGGHPRGMAVDLAADDGNGQPVDFGTGFDHFAESTAKEFNPAHREYPHLSFEAKQNRDRLTKAMVEAAERLNLPMLSLPQEWWDYRFPASYTNNFAPLSDDDLRGDQKMMIAPEDHSGEPDSKIMDELSGLV